MVVDRRSLRKAERCSCNVDCIETVTSNGQCAVANHLKRLLDGLTKGEWGMSQSRWFSGLRWSVWCTLGLMLAAPAAYADGMARRAAPMEQPFSWTGFYVGGHAGLATGDTQGDPNLAFGPP